ncbi:hypothetical protein OIU77_006044 [Salix suchowensis]|uniref:Aldehyde dehydrogenase domain-containing protein n=1 Tax=Salix suchowensis TaxID=1278906 RepID=A0ABQ9ARI4_9ROSI|nr:hypothetical protein OIU77_006044 [Salix suchowensis]
MIKYADLIEEHIEELAALDAIDAGKLFSQGKAVDIPTVANLIRYYAGAADKIHGETLKMSRELQGYTLREPIGVAGHIIPWNFPSSMFFMMSAPALAAGCTMIVKPAEQTPLSALFYADLANKESRKGFYFLQYQLYAEPCIRILYFSGGKSPLLIFDDADVDKAADLALLAVLYNKANTFPLGAYFPAFPLNDEYRLKCIAGIYDEFVKKLKEKAKDWVVGDPFDPRSRLGPQVDKQQFDKILSYIEHGKREGATLLTGGKPIGKTGYFIEPTVFTDVKEEMMIATDEIFGPVMSLMKFETIEEAIKKANNTKYGLAAGIVTQNLDVANTVSRSIRAGTIWINCYFAFDQDCSYGGYKMSGFGRHLGLEALYKYLQVKSVVTPIYNSPWL